MRRTGAAPTRDEALRRPAHPRIAILVKVVGDAALLAAWLGLQWAFDFITSHIPERGALEWAAAKVILAVSTLLLIGNFVYWDIRTAYYEYRSAFEDLARRSEAGVLGIPGESE